MATPAGRVVIDPQGTSCVLSFTGGQLFTDGGCSIPASFPQTVTAATTFYALQSRTFTLSAKFSGAENANGSGGTLPVFIGDNSGQYVTVQPSPTTADTTADASVYAPLASPALTGTPTINGSNALNLATANATYAARRRFGPLASAFPIANYKPIDPFPQVLVSAAGAGSTIASPTDIVPGSVYGGNNNPAAWSAGTTYAQNNLVTYGTDALGAAITWVSQQNGNVGNTPATGSAFWSVVKLDPRFAFLNMPAAVYGKGALYGIQNSYGNTLTPCVGFFGDQIEFVVPGYSQSFRVFVDGVQDPISGTPITGLAAAAVGSGGTFGAGAQFWTVTAVGPLGETLASNEVTATLVANGSANLTWAALPAGTTGVNVYRGTASGAENTLVANLGAVTSYTDTGSSVTATNPPQANGFRYLPNNFGPARVKLTFAAVGDHTIAVQLNGGQLLNVTLGPASRIYAPLLPARPKCVVIGDSQAYGTNNHATLFDTWPVTMAATLGWDTAVDGEPGTGFIAVNTTKKFQDRLPIATAIAPDVLILQGSSNDDGNSGPAVQSAVSACLAAAQAAMPNTLILLTGSFMTIGAADANASGYARQQLTYTNQKAAAAAAGVPFIDTNEWMTGATSTARLPDGLHGDALAARYYGERVAAQVRALLGLSGTL